MRYLIPFLFVLAATPAFAWGFRTYPVYQMNTSNDEYEGDYETNGPQQVQVAPAWNGVVPPMQTPLPPMPGGFLPMQAPMPVYPMPNYRY